MDHQPKNNKGILETPDRSTRSCGIFKSSPNTQKCKKQHKMTMLGHEEVNHIVGLAGNKEEEMERAFEIKCQFRALPNFY
jgi:hypothetical protein